MASRAPKAATATHTVPAAATHTTHIDPDLTPLPNPPLLATTKVLQKGQQLERVHAVRFGAVQFNPGAVGNARFSPIRDKHGAVIPTLYAGTTVDCALLETVFHDVPYTAGLKTFDKAKLADQAHSTVETQEDLLLVDLTTVSLRKLGITRKQLIETEKDRYPQTRPWAEALHSQLQDVQGATWVSRQDDTARAYVFFGDRIKPSALQQKGNSRSLTADKAAYDEVLDLAERLDVNIVTMKP